MIDKEIVTNLVSESLQDSDCFLVDVAVSPDNRIVVEIDNDEGVDIDECVRISRFIEEHLDRDVEDYELEVGSAGLTSPLKVVRQYEKHIGDEMEVLTRAGVKLTGSLCSADEQGFTLSVTRKVKPEGAKRKIEVQEELRFGYDEVKYCKYKI